MKNRSTFYFEESFAMTTKDAAIVRWARRKSKHREDYNHGKHGFIGGNIRYDRRHVDQGGNRSMGKARASSWF